MGDAEAPAGHQEEKKHSTPTWVKVTAIMTAVVVVAVLIVLLATGNHGPGRHAP